jgi:hypothetical protein
MFISQTQQLSCPARDTLDMAANSSEPSTASAYDSAPPPFRRPCSRCEKIVIYNPDFTLSSSLDTIRRQQHGTVVRYGLVIDGSARVLGEGLDDNCQFCKVIRDHHETSANYETLESPHLTAIFQDENDTFSEISGNTQDSVMAMFGQHCVQAFASRTGDFVLSVEPCKSQQFISLLLDVCSLRMIV